MFRDKTICLLLEGTYPFIKGGVSSWIHQMISHYSQYQFYIINLAAQDYQMDDNVFDLPLNVVEVKNYNIFSDFKEKNRMNKKTIEKFKKPIVDMHASFKHFETPCKKNDEFLQPFKKLMQGNDFSFPEGLKHFFASREGWQFIESSFEENCPETVFGDYYWTLVSMHVPLFHIFSVFEDTPEFPLYHSISTGYAGFLASLLSQRNKAPLLLSEHGIYTKERKIDLSKIEPKYRDHQHQEKLTFELDYIQQLWVKYFEILGKITYGQSSVITSLYGGNQIRQIQDGAPQEKTQVVPNGISLERFTPLRQKRPAHIPKIVVLIGRVVPIKDIKTFIRGIKLVVPHIPDIQAWIIGPSDENPEYAQECFALTEALQLNDHIHFLGFKKLEDILPQVGVITLTSISEAQPLVLLEGFAAGIPAIATDVGACRELIEGGQLQEDKNIGSAGVVIPIANPTTFSEAVVSLLDEETWLDSQKAAIRRVETFYAEHMMFGRYQRIYDDLLEMSPY